MREKVGGAGLALIGVVLSFLAQSAVLAAASFIYLRGPLYPPLGDFPAWPVALAIEIGAFALGLAGLVGRRGRTVRSLSLGWMIGFPLVLIFAFCLLGNIAAPVQG